jgi:hypothetical protein
LLLAIPAHPLSSHLKGWSRAKLSLQHTDQNIFIWGSEQWLPSRRQVREIVWGTWAFPVSPNQISSTSMKTKLVLCERSKRQWSGIPQMKRRQRVQNWSKSKERKSIWSRVWALGFKAWGLWSRV